MAPRPGSPLHDLEQTAELPMLQFGVAGQTAPTGQVPVIAVPANANSIDPIADTATWVAIASPADAPAARVTEELERELSDLKGTLSERDALIRRLRSETAGPAVASAATRLLVRTAGDSGITHVLGRRTTIGRTPDNDICIDAPDVSRHHAVVLSVGHDTYIEDLNSANGVRVNGTRVTRLMLVEGDLIGIAESRFRFLLKRP